MKKKYSKIFVFAIISFFVSITPALAREMSLSELGKEIEDKYHGYSAYIIGDYVFTSEHQLTTQDIMLASRSIKVKDTDGATNEDDIYKEMNIYEILQEWNGNTATWKIKNNLVGDTKLSEDKINVKYIDYDFYAEKSEAKISVTKAGEEDYKNALTTLDFAEGNSKYSKELSYDEKTGKLTGHLLKKDSINSFSGDEATGYYFAFVVEVPDATEDTTVTIEGKNKKTATYSNFDVKKDSNKTPGLLVLWSVDPDNVNKTIKVTVDIDGEKEENKNEYEATEYTIDYSALTFQGESKVTLDLSKPSDDDKKTLTDWGYKSELNQDVQLTGGKLTGTLIEQVLAKDNAFGSDKKDGYYFDFKFVTPDGISKENVKIEQLDGENGNVKKTFKKEEFDNDNNLTILFRFDPTTSNCTEDKKSSCKLYYRVDLDGEGDKYLPTIYTIDYSEINFEKSSLFTVEAFPNEKTNEFTETNGWKEKDGYKTEFKTEGKNVKVTGLLPIFDDSEFSNSSNPITGTTGYYLGFVIKTKASINEENKDSINVKFLHNDVEDNKLVKSDFNGSNELYVLKYVDPNAENKTFDITIDLDGEDNNEYAPYTLTIDYSELKFQYKSQDGDYDVVTSENDVKESDQKELASYGYDYELDDVSVKEEQESHVGIQGTIKEQTLKSESGFTEKSGYFVPIKISFPKDNPKYAEYRDKWTVILNTEEGKQKEVRPSKADYDAGYITVLFKIYRDGKPKTITYKLDYDGSENKETNTGYDFLPEEYTIEYEDDVTFESENKITYQYKDEKGEDKEKNVTVYENETVDLKNLDIDTKYRKFDGWYKTVDGENQKVEKDLITNKDEDVTLTAHWTLNVDNFITDVIADLNSETTTNSDNFKGQFNLTQEGNTITINLDSPNVKLTKLADTSIPGAIAYLLEKGEIEEITLKVGNQTVTYNSNYTTKNGKKYTDGSDRTLLDEKGKALKEEIVKGAKGAFDEDLSKKEESATLDELEFIGKSFTIEIGKTDDTVKLVDSDGEEITLDEDKKYTFNFDSDFAVVNSNHKSGIGAKKIEEALSDDKDYSTVYIDSDITLKDTLNITKDVEIMPTTDASGISLVSEDKKTISVSNKEFVFDIGTKEEEKKPVKVTISNLELEGGSKAELKVENQATVTVNNIEISSEDKGIEEGILVDYEGKLTVNGLTFAGETHDVPSVRGAKKVNTQIRAGITMQQATKVDYNIYNVVKHDSKWCTDNNGANKDKLDECKATSYSDEWDWTGDSFYYINQKNVIDYVIVGFMDRDTLKGGMNKVLEKNETIKLPKDYERLTINKKGEDTTYYFVGWGKQSTDPEYRKYSDVFTDIESRKASERDWYYAYYVERDKTITINLTTSGLDKLQEINKTFHTYKFADKAEGMTIGELKKIDLEFAETWETIEDNLGSYNKILISIGNSEDTQEATDDTKITENATITVGVPTAKKG